MVDFPPLAPSIDWTSQYLSLRIQGRSEEEAVNEANRHLGSSRAFGRYVIRDVKGNEVSLSLAVEGGGRQLRDPKSMSGLMLSEHGNWRRVHVGALEASLGRTPFFRYLGPELSRVYQDMSLVSLKAFNTAIFETLLTFLLGNVKVEELADLSGKTLVKDRGKEISREWDKEISIIGPLSLIGRETLIGLLETNY